MDEKSRITRLEERTDGHGEGNRELRQDMKEVRIDIKDLYSQVDALKGGMRLGKWLLGSLLALGATMGEFWRGKQ